MASQIYSRYIPPTKKKSAVPLASVENLPSSMTVEPSTSTPPATRQDASSTYSRYIPSSKKKRTIAVPLNISPVEAPSSPSIAKRKHVAPTEVDQDDGQAQNKKRKKVHIDEPLIAPKIEPNHAPTKDLVAAIEYYKNEAAPPEKSKSKKLKKKQKQKLDTNGTDRSTIPETGLVSSLPKPEKLKKDKVSSAEGLIPEESTGGPEEEVEDEDTRHKKLLRKREKSMRKAERFAKQNQEELADVAARVEVPREEEELHDLIPLPQPEPVPELPTPSIAASLPAWLASPIRVSSTATWSFSNLGLSEDIVVALKDKGFKEALPIQAAVLPLLLPGQAQQPGDVLVSAATGSGKTFSYVLPMMESISRTRYAGIQGLIVVPTRELVAQVRQVCDICATLFSKVDGYSHRPAIGTAVGNETLQVEQETLMNEELVYDPSAYEDAVKAANAPWNNPEDLTAEAELFPAEEFKPRMPGHMVMPYVNVDVLICTPGRLVEHLKSTPGFSVQGVKWLIVDEADKLLDQSFQQWLDNVMGQIHLSQRKIRDRVRKVILSATMTTDIGQLTSLKLHRPKLIVLEGSSTGSSDGHHLAIPALLKESGVKVEDDIIKPLYLFEILRRVDLITNLKGEDHSAPDGSDSSESESGSDSDSDANSSDSDSSDSDSDSDQESTPAAHNSENVADLEMSSTSSALIFTKSNETAVRLGRLIALLCPAVSSKIGILTSTTPRQSRQRTISSFASGKTRILVASDLVSRGLDLPNLAHVINYDIPTSLTNYVHRIGRTARAGKEGHAWTLFTTTEAGWFWREIARNEKIQRIEGAKVERVNIKKEMFDDERQRYDDALEILEKEANSRSGKHES